MVAQARDDYEMAKKWYEKAMVIKRKLNDLRGIASTNHQLVLLAMDARDFKTAEKYSKRTLDINQELGNACGIALAHSILGMAIGEQGRWGESEDYIKRGLLIFIRLNDQPQILASEDNLRSLMAARQ